MPKLREAAQVIASCVSLTIETISALVPAATKYPAVTNGPTGEGRVCRLGMLALGCM